LNRKEKEQTISELQKQIEQYKGAVLTNFRGLKVEQMNQIRQRLREEKIAFHVVKNSLMKLASKGTDLEKINRIYPVQRRAHYSAGVAGPLTNRI